VRAAKKYVGANQEMSRYDDMLKKNQAIENRWNRYGFSEKDWTILTQEQREVHYNRQMICDHKYQYGGISDERLRLQYSHDPYFHTSHMFQCRRKDDPKCDCQMCVGKIGIPRGARFK